MIDNGELNGGEWRTNHVDGGRKSFELDVHHTPDGGFIRRFEVRVSPDAIHVHMDADSQFAFAEELRFDFKTEEHLEPDERSYPSRDAMEKDILQSISYFTSEVESRVEQCMGAEIRPGPPSKAPACDELPGPGL